MTYGFLYSFCYSLGNSASLVTGVFLFALANTDLILSSYSCVTVAPDISCR